MSHYHESTPRPNHRTTSDIEATIVQAWQEQVIQAAHKPALAVTLLHQSRALYERFVTAYRDILALSRQRRRKLLRTLGTSLAGAALALALSHTPAAYAASITVDGSCTLVDAITAANSDTATGLCPAGSSGADTITLLSDVTLTAADNTTVFGLGDNGLPIVTSEITIEGNGHTIARDAGAPDFRILVVDGSGLLVAGSSGNLTLNNTTISGGKTSNTTTSGGGLYNYGGTLTVSNSTISGNSTGPYGAGGGLRQRDGTLTVSNSTVSDNTAGQAGGGGGLSSTVSTLIVHNSTISGNTAGTSGGIYTGGTTTLSNITVSGNTAVDSGGIRFGYGTATLSNSTVTGNSAEYNGGVYNSGTLTLERNVIAGNSAASTQELFNFSNPYSSGTINAANFNVFGHSGQSNADAFANFTPSGSDITATSDGTLPTTLASILNTTLANNGGDTQTHALVTGSPALDAAPTGPATDQRGIARPQGVAFDSGAFELEQATNTAPVTNNDSYSTGEDTPLTVPAPGVLGNDTDGENKALTALLVSGPAHGTLTLNPDGSFTYTPAANFSGSDSFTYMANDGQADSNVATVNLTVVSSASQISQLGANVQALITSGALSASNGGALLNKVDAAQKQLGKGNTNATIVKLNDFITQVNGYIASGKLTAAQGQPLIAAANAVIQSLSVSASSVGVEAGNEAANWLFLPVVTK